MKTSRAQYLAIDAGATATRFCLYEDPLHPLGSSFCRGFNYTLDGRGGLEEVFGATRAWDHRCTGVAAVGLATAGAGRPTIRAAALQDIGDLRDVMFPHADAYLFHDGESALYRCLDDGVGIVISAGTGSIGYARREDGEEARSGGWGHLAGDEGSAYWIALRAFSRVFRSFDGREPGTSLTAELIRQTGVAEGDELVAWLHHPSRKKDEVAAVAVTVGELAGCGDPDALGICELAGEELALLARTLWTRLEFRRPPRIGLTGSVLTGSSCVREATIRAIAKWCPESPVSTSSRSPEVGAALLLAARVGRAPPDLAAPGRRA